MWRDGTKFSLDTSDRYRRTDEAYCYYCTVHTVVKHLAGVLRSVIGDLSAPTGRLLKLRGSLQ